MSIGLQFGVWKYQVTEFSIERDDLYSEGGNPPVLVSKRDSKDTFNRIIVKWTDHSAKDSYSFVTVNDAVDQRITGIVRNRTMDLRGFTSAELATKTAYRLLAESMYRFSTYSFTLAYRNMALKVGQVGYLSDGFGIYRHRVRISKIVEAVNGSRLGVEAISDKQFLYLSPDQAYSVNKHVSYVKPTLVSPSVYFTEGRNAQEVNFHICPQDQYFNGFVIYYSYDDISYNLAGVCTSSILDCNLDGELVTTLGSKRSVIYSPDDAVTVSQNVTFLSLESCSDLRFFNNLSLMKIGSEVVAYKTVVENGINFDVSCFIRGLFNTIPSSHSVGTVWHTLIPDFAFTYNVEDIGKIMYFKVLTFYGSDVQQVEDVTPVTYTIIGNNSKPAPVSIARIAGREGVEDYATDDFDVVVNLASKESGFNIGGVDSVLWGSYARDPGISSMDLSVEEVGGTVIYSESEHVDASTDLTYTKTITLAMRDGHDPVVVKLTPGSLTQADKRSIQPDDSRS